MKIIQPHQNLSRKVEEKGIDLVYKDSAEMIKYCFTPKGFMKGAFAIAHSQVSNDPLAFFVTKEGNICCNPKIVNHTNSMVDGEELCYTFFYKENPVIVPRYNVIEIKYKELIDNKLVDREERFSGKKARIIQHEIDHINAKYIYEIDWKSINKELYKK